MNFKGVWKNLLSIFGYCAFAIQCVGETETIGSVLWYYTLKKETLQNYMGYQYTVTNVTIDTARFYTTLPVHPLISVHFPDKLGGYPVTAIGDQAFADCTIIGQIYLSEGLKSMGSGAFRNSSITYIDIPETLRTIGVETFRGCFNLNGVSIPASVTSIGADAFHPHRFTFMLTKTINHTLQRMERYIIKP